MQNSMVKFQKKGAAPKFFPDGINYNGYFVILISVEGKNQNNGISDFKEEELIMSPFFDFDIIEKQDFKKIIEIGQKGTITIFDILNNNLEHTLVKFESNDRYICLDVPQEMNIRENFSLN